MITTAMKQIYREVLQIKNVSGAPMKRAKYMESALAKREDGVWIQVHNAIEVAFDKLFENAEGIMVKKFGEVFDTLHINFCLLCDDSKAKDDKERESEKALRDVLGEAVAKVKAMLAHDGAITKRHAECKALQVAQAEAAKDPSSLFMPQ
jgi:predicted ATPase with chaperone activity